MTVARLKQVLDGYDDELEVILQPDNSMYGEAIGYPDEGGIVAFYGNNYRCLVFSGRQVGRVADWDEVQDWEEEEEE